MLSISTHFLNQIIITIPLILNSARQVAQYLLHMQHWGTGYTLLAFLGMSLERKTKTI
jgi:hypothetical protein